MGPISNLYHVPICLQGGNALYLKVDIIPACPGTPYASSTAHSPALAASLLGNMNRPA